MHPVDEENKTFNVTLVVNDWTEADLTFHPYLEVINDVNVLVQHFELTVQKPEYNPENEEAKGEGMSRSAIIALIIISILLVVSGTGFGVWFCYSHKYACFQPKG